MSPILVLLLFCSCCLAATRAAEGNCALSPCAAFPELRGARGHVPTTLSGTPLAVGGDFTLPEDHEPQRFSSISDRTSYPQACANAALDEAAFQVFLNEPTYAMILGGLDQARGQQYLDRIMEMEPRILDCLTQFKTSDLVGNPSAVFWMGPSYGHVGALTLRYIHVLVDIAQHFGSLGGFNIAEIGGGFGGQCKILSDIFAVRSYTIIDIPEAVALISRYLSHFPAAKERSLLLAPASSDVGHGVGGSSIEDDGAVLAEYDLCISNYAYTELNLPMRERYWDRILRRCKRGYILDNSGCQHDDDIVEGHRKMGPQVLAEKLKGMGRAVQFEPEVPQTGCNNMVMTWTTPP